jgi:prepilin-type N-terminal cleavage/methylation domain-containing protein
MKRGFTIIELLIVVAIIAILAVVVVLVLNPVELLKQSRDSNRLSDLSTLKTGISLYLQDGRLPNLASSTYGFTGCYLSTISGNGTTTAKCGVFVGAGITTNVSTTVALDRKADSSGWVPVNFSQLSVGTPLTSLPVDPTNNASFYYAYAAGAGSVFEIDAFMESGKYGKNGSTDQAQKDGGDNVNVYETGSSLVL